jgi:hypothetical protein
MRSSTRSGTEFRVNASCQALPGLQDEARRLLGQADPIGLTLRAFGGVAVAMLCPSAADPPLARVYKDLDLVGLRSQRRGMHEFLTGSGYQPDEAFNALNGRDRLLYWDPANRRPLDIVLNTFSMCHRLELADRLDRHPLTLDPTDLLLTKLQVVELGENDALDAISLLLDCDIDVPRISEVLASDWGWWRTVGQNLARISDFARSLKGFDAADAIAGRARQVMSQADQLPKSYRWRARSRLGDRVRWYEIPEEEPE